MSQRFPESTVPLPYNRTARLVDDSFNKLCVAATDPAVSVRTLACRLLGTYQTVELKYLLQTLGKEILSGEHKGSLTLNRGRPTETPEGDILASDAVIDSDAIGVIIQGLEDEFYEVRNATVGNFIPS